jgi:hypothetical protein
MINVTINGIDYIIHEDGERPWGEDTTNLLLAMVNQLNTLVVQGDINLTTVSINNNQASPLDITGLLFDTAYTLGAFVEYNIRRSTSLSSLVETGTLILSFDSITSTWSIARYDSGSSSGVDFSITAGGQLQYTSSNMSGTSYSGQIKYRARILRS